MTKSCHHDLLVLLLSILFTTLNAAPQKRSCWKSDYTFVYIYGSETPETSTAALSTAVASVPDPDPTISIASELPSIPSSYPATDITTTVDDESSPTLSVVPVSPTGGADETQTGGEEGGGGDGEQGQDSRSDPESSWGNIDDDQTTLTTLTEVFTLGSVTPKVVLVYPDSTNTIDLGLETDTSSQNIPTRALIANTTVTPVPAVVRLTSHPPYITIISPAKPTTTTTTTPSTSTPSPIPTPTSTSTTTPSPTTLSSSSSSSPTTITPPPPDSSDPTSTYDIDAMQTSYYHSVCSWPEHVDDAICLSENSMMCCRSDNEKCAAVLADGGLSCKGIQSGDWATTWTRPTVIVTVTATGAAVVSPSPSVRPTPGRKGKRRTRRWWWG